MAIPQDKLKIIMDGVADKIRHAYNCGEEAGRKAMIEKYKTDVGEKVDRALNQNNGFWTVYDTTEIDINLMSPKRIQQIKCDQCNTTFIRIGHLSWRYCPHCGAAMSYYIKPGYVKPEAESEE